jgi:hypothetical protein
VNLTADQLRGRVRVLIDGEEKFLRFDQTALAHLIEVLQLETLSGLPQAVSMLDAEVLRKLIWSGRLWEEPDLKIEDVAGWFFPLLPTYEAAIEAINLSLWGTPTPNLESGGSDDDADPPKTETVGTSSEPETSGLST